MAIKYIFAAAAALVVLLAVGARPSTAQAPVPSCASKLMPCAAYLNATTKPPESCCGSMKEVVSNELSCLCSLFNSPDLLKAFGINITQALQLPKSCGINSDTSICSKGGAVPPSAKTSPASGGGSTGKNDSSGAFAGETWIGMPSSVSLLVFAWSLMVW